MKKLFKSIIAIYIVFSLFSPIIYITAKYKNESNILYLLLCIISFVLAISSLLYIYQKKEGQED